MYDAYDNTDLLERIVDHQDDHDVAELDHWSIEDFQDVLSRS